MKRFTKDLGYGDWGTEVKHLQDFLESKGYGIFRKLPFRFFGDTTYKRVKEFQLNNGIFPPTGNFYVLSRTAANKIIAKDNADKLYQTATSFLGVDASPNDVAPDEYGCAETVDTVYYNAFGHFIGYNPLPTISTARLYQELLNSEDFTASDTPSQGCIIISPTGKGNGVLPNGHVGIVGVGQLIMSNNSFTGKFEANYTIESWTARYKVRGGYPVYFFRVV